MRKVSDKKYVNKLDFTAKFYYNHTKFKCQSVSLFMISFQFDKTHPIIF